MAGSTSMIFSRATEETVSDGSGRGPAPPHIHPRGTAGIIRSFGRRLTERQFWYVQAALVLVTALHVATELPETSEYLEILQNSTVVLYLVPIAYASLHYGWEGGLASGIWVVVLALPNAILWHSVNYAWVGEIIKLGVVVFVGLILAWRVDVESGLRRRAEAAEATLRSLLHEVTRAQEEERGRIARELHDEVAQDMAMLRRELDELLREECAASPYASRRLNRARDVAAQSLTDIRSFIHDLRPPMLEDLGLAAALEALVNDLVRTTGISGRLGVTGEVQRLDPEAELSLYRIAQEAIRNARKHAKAGNVDVTLIFGEGEVRLGIADDGVGFDRDRFRRGDDPQPDSLGLIGMQERATLLGASLDIDSTPGHGTRVVTTYPFHPASS